MSRYRATLILQLLIAASSFAQDSVSNFSLRNVNFAFEGGLIYQGEPFGKIIIPDYFRQQNPSTPQYAGDNPLDHGAAYMRPGLAIHYNGFLLNASLTAEHRGQSY